MREKYFLFSTGTKAVLKNYISCHKKSPEAVFPGFLWTDLSPFYFLLQVFPGSTQPTFPSMRRKTMFSPPWLAL